MMKNINVLLLCMILFSQVLTSDTLKLRDQDVLTKVKMAIQAPTGHKLSIKWQYQYEGDTWSGDGTLYILGKDYLKLVLPYQEILIKKTTVMTRYVETDQVIIDYFDRDDPTNLFSILLGDFSGFSITEVRAISDSLSMIKLVGETLVGFEELDMSVNSYSWMPEFLEGRIGQDISVSIEVKKVELLENPGKLKSDVLLGNEVIDLR